MPSLERKPGYIGKVITAHRNTQEELLTIEVGRLGPVLCLYDSETPIVAPVLLDAGTIIWLKAHVEDTEEDVRN